MVASLWKHS